MTVWRLLLLLSLVVFVPTGTGACSSDDSTAPSGDRIDYAFGPNTRPLDTAALAALQDGADTSQTLTFDAAQGSKFGRGDVLLAGKSPKTPRGLLRIVTSATTENGVTRLTTEQAPIQLAFKKLHAHVERTIPVVTSAPAPLRPRAGFQFDGVGLVDEFVFNGDKDPATVEDQLRLNDSFSGEIGLTLDIDVDWGIVDTIKEGIDHFIECFAFGTCDLSLPTLTATVSARMKTSTTFDHSGAASAGYSVGPFPMGDTRTLTEIEIGPLLIIPELQFTGKTQGKAGSYARLVGSAEMGFDLSASISTAGSVKADATPIKSFRVDTAEAFLDANIKNTSGPRLNLLAYGAIGPTVGVDFWNELDIDRTRSADCYRATMGIAARFGFLVKFPWRALGEYFANGDKEVGEDVAYVANLFGLDGTILDTGKSFDLTKEGGELMASGPCTSPPESILPPGTPKEDILADPPFVPWSKRLDEPGLHFADSATPHSGRGALVLGVDGHLWAMGTPSPTLRRVAIDGRSLSASRFWAPDELDPTIEVPLPVTGLLERTDLVKWVLLENGTIARLGPDDGYIDAFGIDIPKVDGEVVALRRGATRADGRTALLFGIHQRANEDDHRMVLVELAPSGKVLRARAMGEPTSEDFQSSVFATVRAMYRPDGSLIIAGESAAGVAQLDSRCFVMSVNDDGNVGFATAMKTGRENGTCKAGAVSIAANGDIVMTGSSGEVFANSGVFGVLDPNGQLKVSSGFSLGGSSYVAPTFVERLGTTGYILMGLDTQDAYQAGTFIARLDGEGLPLGATSLRTPSKVQVGFPDAFVTKDGGILFAALAEWGDQAAQRDLTRFFVGKAFAKDGTLGFNAASETTTVKVEDLAGARGALTGESFSKPFSDVAARLAKRTLRPETFTSAETVLAP